MNNKPFIKEFTLSEADEYSEFGLPYEGIPTEDPLSCCMPGSYFSCTNKTADLGLCPLFMSQRCASKWDEQCDIYLSTLSDWNLKRNFINDTAEKKFCSLNQNSNCTKHCQPLDPIAQDSVQVCDFIGTEITTIDENGKIVVPTSTEDLVPIANKEFSVQPEGQRFSDTVATSVSDPSMYLDYSNPTYMSMPCRKNCDLIAPNNLEIDDPVINACLQYGICSDVLSNICDTADSTGGGISHVELAKLCEIRNVDKANIIQPNQTKLQSVRPKFSSHKTPERQCESTTIIMITLFVLLILLLIFIIVLIYGYISNKRKK